MVKTLFCFKLVLKKYLNLFDSYHILLIGSDSDAAEDLLPLFDREVILQVKHCLLPVRAGCVRG